jgi:hypothetical protein
MAIKRSAPRSILNINSRQGWHDYYVARYNKNPTNEDACTMALWYMLLMLQHGELLTLEEPDPVSPPAQEFALAQEGEQALTL